MFWFKETAEKYIKKGNKAFDKFEFINAINEYTNAINLEKDYAYAYYLRSKVHSATKNFDKTLNDINQILNILNSQFDNLFREAEKRTFSDYNSKEYFKAVAKITKDKETFLKYIKDCKYDKKLADICIKDDCFMTKYFDILFDKINILFQKREYDLISDELAVLSEIKPEDKKFASLKDEIIKSTQRNKELIEQMNNSISGEPEKASLYVKRARYYINDKQYDAATNDIETAINIGINPEDKNEAAAIIDTLTDFNKRRGNFEKAMELINKAITLAPENAHYYLMRGGLYFDTNKTGEAKADFEKVMAMSPSASDKYDCEKYLEKV
jgi:tetratricopeptide (TPR) repeat protein